MTETPATSAILVAAADHIREMAIHFEGYHGGPDGDDRFADSAEQWAYYSTDRNASVDARRWIAALSPAVAPALERILRDAAKDWDVRARIFNAESMEEAKSSRHFAGAFALARALVGEEQQYGVEQGSQATIMFTGAPDNFDEVCRFLGDQQHGHREEGYGPNAHLVLYTPEGELRVNVGDSILRRDDGSVEVARRMGEQAGGSQ